MIFSFNLPSNVTENAEDQNDDEMIQEEEEVEESIRQFVSESAMHILLEESDKEELIDSGELDEMEEEGQVSESAVVRLDRDSRIRQLTKLTVFKMAREKSDPKMKKLLNIWRVERKLENDLLKKYGSKAKRVAQKEVRTNYKQVGRRFVRVKKKKGRK